MPESPVMTYTFGFAVGASPMNAIPSPVYADGMVFVVNVLPGCGCASK